MGARINADSLQAAAGVLRALERINKEVREVQLHVDRGVTCITLGDGDRVSVFIGETPMAARPELVALLDKAFAAQQEAQLARLAEMGFDRDQFELVRLELRGA